MTARALMVWRTSSGAGKSWLCTALGRWAARQSVDVVPFKTRNMRSNARVVPGLIGAFGEIASTQYFQAIAVRVAPDAHMNPALLAPGPEQLRARTGVATLAVPPRLCPAG